MRLTESDSTGLPERFLTRDWFVQTAEGARVQTCLQSTVGRTELSVSPVPTGLSARSLEAKPSYGIPQQKPWNVPTRTAQQKWKVHGGDLASSRV